MLLEAKIKDINIVDYDHYEDLIKDLHKIYEISDREELEGVVLNDLEITCAYRFHIPSTSLEQVYDSVKTLEEYEEYDQEIILSYWEMYYTNLDINHSGAREALDNYFGWYESDYDAAREFLKCCLDMNNHQADYVLDTLNCADNIVENEFDNNSGHYFSK